MKNIKYFIPLLIVLLLPWTFRLSLENILLAVPDTTISNAKEISWVLGGVTTIIVFLIFIIYDATKGNDYK